MPRFDMPGRTVPTKLILAPGGRERVFELPYQTDDPADIALLLKHGLVAVRRPPVEPPAVASPEADPAPKPRASRKEV